MVLELPPAPAALVLAGLALATLSALSAAAFLLIAVAGPPGALGELGRAVEEPDEAAGESTGEVGRGDDYWRRDQYNACPEARCGWGDVVVQRSIHVREKGWKQLEFRFGGCVP